MLFSNANLGRALLSNSGASDGDDDWETVIDPSSGNTYYYNHSTGETSWDEPRALRSETQWEEVTDRDSGDTYFHNRTTGATSWDRPPAVITSNSSDAGVGSGGGGGGTDTEWEEVQDEASGHPYWYNRRTNETTWDRPEQVQQALVRRQGDQVEQEHAAAYL